MSDQQDNSEKKEAKQQTSQVKIQDILYMGLRNWPWIIASVVVCVGLALFYTLRTPSVYTRSASILIKDDSNGKSVGDYGDFGDLGLVQSNTNANIEVALIQSSGMMEEVVRALGLDMNYSVKGKFHDEVLYGSNLPVRVVMPEVSDTKNAVVHVDLDKGGKVTLSDFMLSGEKHPGSVTGLVGDTIPTPLGTVVVDTTKYYNRADDYSINVSKSTIKAAVGSYKGRLLVNLKNDKIPVIVLTFTDRSIQRADDVLNALIAIYNENWIRDKNQISVSTSNFIDERLSVIESELGSVDQDISRYKSEHLIPDVQAVQAIDLGQVNSMAQQLIGLNSELQIVRYVRNYITDESNRNKLLPANSGIQTGNIESQISSYNEKLMYRNSLAASSSENNPLVAELDENLNELRRALISSVDNQIVALNTQIRSLQNSEAKATSRIAANPAQAKYLLSVERQQKIKESLYLFLLQKREENELSQAFTAYNTRVIEMPNGSGAPTAPARGKIVMVAFFVGLLLPFGIIFLRESMYSKVRGRKDIEFLSLPFLGEIPFSGRRPSSLLKRKKKEETEQNTLVVRSGQRDVVNEAFRVLRTNVEFMKGHETPCSVTVITSFNPGSGKSFITVNLAMSLAIKNRKVLVIDGDMRHGSTSSFIGSPKSGLSNYLSGNIEDINSVIVTDKNNSNLQFIPVGTIPPNPTELLENGAFDNLIKSLRSKYDYIFIDCPPIEIVADTQIIEQYADRTIFVIRAGLFERSMLPELEKIYSNKKFKNMSLILNGTMSEDHNYSYSYRYGYGYGYGYGYHYGNVDSKK